MRLLECKVRNFSSYRELEFSFDNQGLALIQGATGSGKSTLQDIPCWILFGVTAKDGSVDDVRSWFAGAEPTQGELTLECFPHVIRVTRIRGNASQNDLFFQISPQETQIRGKDLNETQKMLEAKLGVSSELYLSAAYFSEFNPTAHFFLSDAKRRRAIFENVADLKLPVLLAKATSEAKKETKGNIKIAQTGYDQSQAKLEILQQSLVYLQDMDKAWDARHAEELQLLQAKVVNYNKEKASKLAELQTKLDNFAAKKSRQVDEIIDKIHSLQDKLETIRPSDLGEKCPTCKQPHKKFYEQKAEMDRLGSKLDNLKFQLEIEVDSSSPYEEKISELKVEYNHYLGQLERHKLKTNPNTPQISKVEAQIHENHLLVVQGKTELHALNAQYASLEQLYDLSFELRGTLLLQAISDIQDSTNSYMSAYFDSEIRVEFSLPDSDKLEVGIFKNGYECNYKQLSKGQRQLLRLCFVLSYMKAASNKAGVHFADLFLDEALDGLDADLKVKAYALLQELESNHESVFVIDHSTELKTMFDKQYKVTLQGDESIIEEQNAG